MTRVNLPELLVIIGVALLLFGAKSFQEILAGLLEGLSNFRGGPGSPSHPIPGNDSRLLNRRSKPAEDSGK